MFEKRLISALFDQAAILSTAVKTLADSARRYDRGYKIEELLHQATSGMLQACDGLSKLERLLDQELSA